MRLPIWVRCFSFVLGDCYSSAPFVKRKTTSKENIGVLLDFQLVKRGSRFRENIVM